VELATDDQQADWVEDIGRGEDEDIPVIAVDHKVRLALNHASSVLVFVWDDIAMPYGGVNRGFWWFSGANGTMEVDDFH